MDLYFFNMCIKNGFTPIGIHYEFNNNKKSITPSRNWQLDTFDNKKIRSHYNAIALKTGKLYDLTVIDFDDIDEHNKLIKQFGEIDTVKVQTRKGFHYYFKYNELIKNNSKLNNVNKIDGRNNNGFIMIKSPDNAYKLLTPLKKKLISDIPKWLLDLLIIKPIIKPMIKEELSDDEISIDTNNYDYNDNTKHLLIDELLKHILLLDKEYITTHKKWKILYLACNYESINNKWIKNIFQKFSKQNSNNYNEKDFENNWISTLKNDRKNKYNIGTIINILKELDINKYNEVKILYNNQLQFNTQIMKFTDKKMKDEAFYKDNKELLNININANPYKFDNTNNQITQNIGLYFCVKCDEKEKMIVFVKNNKFAYICIKCKTCYPTPLIKLEEKEIKIIYNIVNNTQNNITNNFNNTNKSINKSDIIKEYSEKMILDDDNEINTYLYLNIRKPSYIYTSKIIYKLYKDEYLYDGIYWHHFNNHIWKKYETNMEAIVTIVNNIIIKQYHPYLLSIKTKIDNSDIFSYFEKYEETVYSNKSFVDDTIKQLTYDFTRKNIIDKNLMLLGFNNGIFDFNTFTFRDGKPNDYVSMSTGYDYDDSIDTSLIEKIISEIIPNKRLKDYTLQAFSNALIGNNSHCHFWLLNGSGRNGKSLLTLLISKALGDYSGEIPTNVLTKPTIDEKNPSLYKCLNKRLILSNETEKGEVLQMKTVKILTSKEPFYVRTLYIDIVEFIPNFLLFMNCNDLPEIKSDDDGTWRRVRSIEFHSKFIEEPKNKNEYKRNDEYSKIEFLNKNRSSMMKILIEYLKRELKEPLKDIPEIIVSTNKYKQTNDYIQMFIDECIEETNNRDDIIKWKDLRIEYERWYLNEGINKVIPSNKELREKFHIKHPIKFCKNSDYTIKTDGWNCCKFKIPQNN